MNKKVTLLLVLFVCVAIVFIGNWHYTNKINSHDTSMLTDININEDYQERDLYLYSLNGNIDIYVKGNREDSDRYIGYHLIRSKKDLDTDESVSNYDILKLDTANEYQRSGKDNFRKKSNIVASSEWEFAIKEVGANDFVGGRMHGDEILSEVKIFVDGEELDPDKFAKIDVDEVKIITQSEIFRDNTISDDLVKIGTTETSYVFNKEGLTLDQKIYFEESLMIERAYLGMFPILRNSEGIAGDNVTNTVITNYDNVEYDVSEPDFNIPELNRVEATKVNLFGEGNGISATVEVLEKSPDYSTTFILSNSAHYNKVYYNFVEGEYEVSEGEVWKQTTHYKIESTK